MRKLEDVIELVKKTLEDKGNTYGPTYRRVATMLAVQPQYSIMVRMLEKIARAHNILRTGGSQEHLREEFVDIACYAILAAFESEGNFEVTLKDAPHFCAKCGVSHETYACPELANGAK